MCMFLLTFSPWTTFVPPLWPTHRKLINIVLPWLRLFIMCSAIANKIPIIWDNFYMLSAPIKDINWLPFNDFIYHIGICISKTYCWEAICDFILNICFANMNYMPEAFFVFYLSYWGIKWWLSHLHNVFFHPLENQLIYEKGLYIYIYIY